MDDATPPSPPPEPSRPSWPSRVHLSDVQALRAYAHPTRMRLVGLLRLRGPLTATQAADLVGQSVASCSYHLRMLAKYGLVEEAEGGTGREKPWRATARYTSWPDHSDDPAVGEATAALSTAVAEYWFERITHAIETRHALSREWQEAEEFGDSVIHLTPAELTELRDRFRELVEEYAPRAEDPRLRPEGAELVQVLRIAYKYRDEPPGAPG
ncbi:helix-turn-helix domain-containing protein [Streptomyces radicis]|uniref:ArsR family transcriptional regulator n=1 Tax=Streptomyces radicis TaxID=1750517 RepID=A0A3A9WHX3_9ACTN|nr:helix-turn-helix domain-containing protein [Streptomyces radicis]RKN11913.1 ArsR family transcriptional regulator [Streptomyces radicis]RKN26037.1 ArsR family transcriptional regulator [Streptomyces radicis]